MLLWVNNHYSDFERDPIMEDYLETFEKGLEQQVSSGNVPGFTLLCVNQSGEQAPVDDEIPPP